MVMCYKTYHNNDNLYRHTTLKSYITKGIQTQTSPNEGRMKPDIPEKTYETKHGLGNHLHIQPVAGIDTYLHEVEVLVEHCDVTLGVNLAWDHVLFAPHGVQFAFGSNFLVI